MHAEGTLFGSLAEDEDVYDGDDSHAAAGGDDDYERLIEHDASSINNHATESTLSHEDNCPIWHCEPHSLPPSSSLPNTPPETPEVSYDSIFQPIATSSHTALVKKLEPLKLERVIEALHPGGKRKLATVVLDFGRLDDGMHRFGSITDYHREQEGGMKRRMLEGCLAGR